MTRRQVRLAAVGFLLAVAAMTGCGSDDAGTDAPPAAAEVAAENPMPVGDGPIDGADGTALIGTENAPPVAPQAVPTEDVTIDCPDGSTAGTVTLTNTASEARHFHVTVFVRDGDGVRVGQQYANPYNVAPGETVRSEINREDAPGPCTLDKVIAVPADEVPDRGIWWPLPLFGG